MPDINTLAQLEARIAVLEQRDAVEWKSLKKRLKEQYDAIRPSNVLKNILGDIKETVHHEADIIHNGAALASHLVADTIASGSKNKPLKKWLSLVLFSIATFFISKHREEIEEGGEKLLEFVSDQLKKSKKKKNDESKLISEKEEDDSEEN